MSTKRRVLASTAAIAALAMTLSACGGTDRADEGSSEGSGSGSAGEGDLSGELLIWAWDSTIESVVDAFEEANPEVDVELVNAGTGNDQYVALQNAIGAGSGVPDIAQIEYFAVPQFAIGEGLADIGPLGAADLESTFTPGPWGSVNVNGGVYGLPIDSGPMALFYNEAVFTEHGVEVPTTWDEYLEAARALHAADPNLYITNDTGDAGFTTSMIWQAGGHPYEVDGTEATVNFDTPEVKQFTDVWQTMIDEGLLAPVSSWSDDWNKGLGDGTIASLTIGAWMPTNLENGAPAAEGDWRVAPMPQWEAGADLVTAENGGSALSVTSASADTELAYAFLEFAAVNEGVQLRVDGGAFPATVAELEDEEFLGKEFPYFGNQKLNEVLAESAKAVAPGWQYLPFQVYTNSIFNDSVGQAYIGGTTLTDGLAAWQDATIKYGNEQGFTVN
ncbi:sugar ABC transporter substrate-binding protein [Serinibacter arcticus]|uniref:Sugar ABC transporter substrate-binding protein n=1 Tax=Serinibacter arcticus TaxID=1655435 RepID=A0A2U1ZZU7_9MICO|nr:sugar ABC transporter substrate-binding protein [Serinibacter arcticus]PWD52499.1 sugar ABC transporter substrate-binding protein [Serinibacter arcticus]